MLPLIILRGPAGSGKDTVGEMLERNFGAQRIAQADPMKRFCREVFNFTDDQLWGPSECRDAIDIRYKSENAVLSCMSKYHFAATKWVHEVAPPETDQRKALRDLDIWVDRCIAAGGNGGLSPRLALQWLGTEWGREGVDRDIWTQYANKMAIKLLGGGYRYSAQVGLIRDAGARCRDYVVITDGRFANEIITVKSRGGMAWNITGRARDLGIASNHASEKDYLPQHFFDYHIDNSGTLAALENNVYSCMAGSYNDPRCIRPTNDTLHPDRLLARAGV